MNFMVRAMIYFVFVSASNVSLASNILASDATPQMAFDDISRSWSELEPITFQASTEKHRLLVFIENQCVYCSKVVKDIKKYTDAGLTMSFVTVVPSSMTDSVIEDMGRVWCASDRPKSLQNAMAGFLPENDSSEHCKNLVIKQSELADRLGLMVTPAMIVIDKSAHIFLGSVSPDKILSDLK